MTGGLLAAWAGQAYSACPNPHLVADILRCEAICSRYWYAAVARGFPSGTLLAGLADLLARLREGRRAEAATAWPTCRVETTEQAAALLP